MAIVAERAFIGRNTLTRVDRDDPGVSLGIYTTVLFMLGLADRGRSLADPSTGFREGGCLTASPDASAYGSKLPIRLVAWL